MRNYVKDVVLESGNPRDNDLHLSEVRAIRFKLSSGEEVELELFEREPGYVAFRVSSGGRVLSLSDAANVLLLGVK